MAEEYEPSLSYSRSDYRGMLNYESILSTHIQKLMQYRDTSPKLYCSSIETLIIHCPKKIREKAFQKLGGMGLIRGHYNEIAENRLILYDDLIIYINELLEKNNLIFKTGKYEVGHD